MNLAEAQMILAAWQDTNLVGMMGFNLRFNALYQRAKQYTENSCT